VRLVRVKAPEGKGSDVAQVAFDAGVSQVALSQQQVLTRNKQRTTKDVIDIETSTPTAKAFTDALMSSSFFDPKEYSISVRQPRSIVSQEKPAQLTRPFVEPTTDVFEELWQFSHITQGFIGRVFIASLLLAYGMIESKILFIVAGLLFMPLLPLMLAIGFGFSTQEWRLAAQGAFAFIVAMILTALGGSVVALMTEPPLKYTESSSLLTGFLISLAVGTAAALASSDDAGRRELIGLAATAQIAIVPVWFGVSLVFGFVAMDGTSPYQRASTFLVNVITIIAASLITFTVLKMRGQSVRRCTPGASDPGDR
jgi:hypothetical protein